MEETLTKNERNKINNKSFFTKKISSSQALEELINSTSTPHKQIVLGKKMSYNNVNNSLNIIIGINDSQSMIKRKQTFDSTAGFLTPKSNNNSLNNKSFLFETHKVVKEPKENKSNSIQQGLEYNRYIIDVFNRIVKSKNTVENKEKFAEELNDLHLNENANLSLKGSTENDSILFNKEFHYGLLSLHENLFKLSKNLDGYLSNNNELIKEKIVSTKERKKKFYYNFYNSNKKILEIQNEEENENPEMLYQSSKISIRKKEAKEKFSEVKNASINSMIIENTKVIINKNILN